MKKILHYVVEVAKVCLNAVMAALCFVKLDHEAAPLPDGERIDHYYSIYDKLCGKNLQVLVYIALAAMAASAILSIVTCITKCNGKMRITSHIVFVIAIAFFAGSALYAMQFLQLSY